MRTFALTHNQLHPGLDYDAFCECAQEGFGNYYDFIPRESSRLIVSVGDVPQSAERSALTIPFVQALIRGLTSGDDGDLAGAARELNKTLYLLGSRDLCSPWFYARLDPVRHEMRYVNAGHEAPYLIRDRGQSIERLERTGAALGLSIRKPLRQETVALEPGDILAICSEGVADAGALDVVLANPEASAAELTRRVLEMTSRVALDVDRTFVAIRVIGAYARPILEESEAEPLLACAA